MSSTILIIAVLVCSTYAALNTCTDDSQCAATECCQILSEFMIVSRRGLPQLVTKPPRTGTCHPYQNEGDNCGTFDKANGYCSCAPGLTCKGLEVLIGTPTPTQAVLQAQNRKLIPPRPGYRWEFKCRRM